MGIRAITLGIGLRSARAVVRRRAQHHESDRWVGGQLVHVVTPHPKSLTLVDRRVTTDDGFATHPLRPRLLAAQRTA